MDNPPPPSSLPLSQATRHSNFSPNNDQGGKPVEKGWRRERKKDTSCLLIRTFPFPLWFNKRSIAIDGSEVCKRRMSEQFPDTLSRAGPKAHLCVERKAGGIGYLGWEATWVFGGDQCWCEHDVSLRGDQGLRMKGTAASSSVFGRLCAAVGTIVDMLICIRLAGAPARHRRPRGVALFKMEAKGRASRHPASADTYPYILSTTVHSGREIPVSARKYKQW